MSESQVVKFEPKPYRHDGGFTPFNIFLLSITLGLVGYFLGILVSWIGQYFYLIILFPLIMGGIVGVVGAFMVKKLKIRHAAWCGLAGLVAGLLTQYGVHDTDYQRFRGEVDTELKKNGDDVELYRKLVDHSEEIQSGKMPATDVEKAFLDQILIDKEFTKVLKVNSLMNYLNFAAEKGVEISGKGGNALNLGYYGSYIYWSIEALLVAGIALAIMNAAAQEPFCTDCADWKIELDCGVFEDSSKVQSTIQSGELIPLETSQSAGTRIKLHYCKNCSDLATVDVELESITFNNKGESSSSNLGKWSYPPEALSTLLVITGRNELPTDET